MNVPSLNSIAYDALVNSIGLCSNEIILGKKYYFIEDDGTYTYLDECVFHDCDSRICWHDGFSWWEIIKFKNTTKTKYSINRGGGGGSHFNKRLPIVELPII